MSRRREALRHNGNSGADVRVVQELLGHASVTTTQIYTLVTVHALREVWAGCAPKGALAKLKPTSEDDVRAVHVDPDRQVEDPLYLCPLLRLKRIWVQPGQLLQRRAVDQAE